MCQKGLCCQTLTTLTSAITTATNWCESVALPESWSMTGTGVVPTRAPDDCF